VEVVVLKKLCAVLLFVFVATLFAASMAFAASPMVTRNHIDYLSVDTTGIKHNLRPGYNIGLEKDISVTAQDTQRIIRHVSKDAWHVGKSFVFAADPTGTERVLGMKSADYDLMRLYSPDLRTFFNVPPSVVNMLYGGNGSFPGNDNKDTYGFTVQRDHVFEIVNKIALNPADGGHVGEGGVLAVYMFSVDLTAGQILGKDTIVVPVGLNYEFYSDDTERHAYTEVAAGRPGVPYVDMYVVSEDASADVAVKTYATKKVDTGAKVVGGEYDPTSNDAYAGHIYGTNRFTGMKAGEIKLVKVFGNADGNYQMPFNFVDSKEKLEHGKFVIVKSQVVKTNGVATVTDTALKADELILNDYAYRILFAVRDQETNFDFTTNDSFGSIVDPVIVYAESPFLKDPNIDATGSYKNTVEELKWNKDPSKLGAENGSTGVQLGAFRIASMTGPGIVASHPTRGAVWAFMDDEAYPSESQKINDYPATVRDTFYLDAAGLGAKKDNMVWLKDSVIEQYGYDVANVHQFPMTLGRVSARQNTGIVLFSIRDLTPFVGKKVSDVTVVNANAQFGSVSKYTLATDKTGMVDGTFAVLQRDPNYPTASYAASYKQVMMGADATFEEGKAYFIALAAKDGGDFDVQQGRQGIADSKNDRVVHYAAFAVVAGTTPQVPTLVLTPSGSTTMEPGDTVDLVVTVSDGSAVPVVTWDSSDAAIASFVVSGDTCVVTAEAVGTANITCVPEVGSGINPATPVVITVAHNTPSGGSSGGCSVGGFAPATLLLLAPLFLLLKK